MMMIRFFRLSLVAVVFGLLSGCVSQPTSNGFQAETRPSVTRTGYEFESKKRVLMMGDSMLAWNRWNAKSVGDQLADRLGMDVVNKSIIGATHLSPVDNGIIKQYKRGDWEWVVINGGGNDLWLGCGCVLCQSKIDRLIGADGSGGQIGKTIDKLVKDGMKVVYVGYMRTPGSLSPVEHCAPIGKKLEERVAKKAIKTPNVYFLSLENIVPHGNRSYHAIDKVHPSEKGSRFIANYIADIIQSVDGTSRAARLN